MHEDITDDWTEAEPGDRVMTDEGPATVLAAADSVEEAREHIERLIEEGR